MQRGRLKRQTHKRGPDVWQFRWSEVSTDKHSDWVAQSQFSSSRAARDWKIERTDARSVVRKMGMSEDYEGCVTPSAQIFRHFREARSAPCCTSASEGAVEPWL
jgi:hypothetical protein